MTAAAQRQDVSPSRPEIEAALAALDQHDHELCMAYIADLNTTDGAEQAKVARELLADVAAIQATRIPQAQRGAPVQPVAVPAPVRATNAQPRAAADAPANLGAGAWRIFGFASLVFGLMLWIPGAHYQLDGLTLIVNVVLDMIRIGYQFPLATGWWALLLVVCGVTYSIGERKFLPARKSKRTGWRFLGWGVVLVWMLVNGSDMVSAYMGITQPLAADAWPITRWMAARWWATIAWMLTVVYIGDILITLGVRWMGIPIPRWIRRLWE